MKAKRWKRLPFLVAMGKTANFYVPAAKMNDPRYARDGRTAGQLFDEFLIGNFGGFTHEVSQIRGQWVGDNGTKVFTDEHQRYEVAFGDKSKAAEFFRFMAEMCRLLEESSIYVTYGGNSWLVAPHVSDLPDAVGNPNPSTSEAEPPPG